MNPKPKLLSFSSAFFLSLSFLSLGLSGAVFAEDVTEEEKGYRIAAASDRSDRGFGDSEVTMTMVLRNEKGEESVRELYQRTLEIENENLGDRTLIVFSQPADIDGTALLSHAKIHEPDDQWLYLPAFKRVKRISSVNKDGAFVGSEFAYEDFTALELNKFRYRYIGEEPCAELICDMIERIPQYVHSGYSKQIAWVDQRDLQVRKVEFYSRAEELLKVLSFTDYRQYDNHFWRAHKLAMRNVKTGKSTDLIFSEFRVGNGYEEHDFVRGVLNKLQ